MTYCINGSRRLCQIFQFESASTPPPQEELNCEYVDAGVFDEVNALHHFKWEIVKGVDCLYDKISEVRPQQTNESYSISILCMQMCSYLQKGRKKYQTDDSNFHNCNIQVTREISDTAIKLIEYEYCKTKTTLTRLREICEHLHTSLPCLPRLWK